MQEVAVVQQNQAFVAALPPLLLHEGRDTRQAAQCIVLLDEVIRVIMAVHVRGFHDFQLYHLLLGKQRARHEQEDAY